MDSTQSFMTASSSMGVSVNGDAARPSSTALLPDPAIEEEDFELAIERSRNVTKVMYQAMTESLEEKEKVLKKYMAVNTANIQDFAAGAGRTMKVIETVLANSREHKAHRWWVDFQLNILMAVGVVLLGTAIGWAVGHFSH